MNGATEFTLAFVSLLMAFLVFALINWRKWW